MKTISRQDYKYVCGATLCNGNYLIQPKDNCTQPASSGAMLRLNTTDGTIKVVCSVGGSPYGTFDQDNYISCFPSSSMQVLCLDTQYHRWCEGTIAPQWSSKGK